MSETEAPGRKTINVKGVDAAIWDKAGKAADRLRVSLGTYLSDQLVKGFKVDAGEISLPGERGANPSLTLEQFVALNNSNAAMLQAAALAKQARLRVPRDSDLGRARALAADAAEVLAPQITGRAVSKRQAIGKEPPEKLVIQGKTPGDIDRYDVAPILHGTDTGEAEGRV